MSTGTPGRWVLPVRHFLIGVTRVIFRVNRDLGLTTNRPIPGSGKGLNLKGSKERVLEGVVLHGRLES